MSHFFSYKKLYKHSWFPLFVWTFSNVIYMPANVTRSIWKTFATPCRATRALKEIWECQVPQGTKVPLVYQAYRWEMQQHVKNPASPQPHQSHSSCPPLGYQWGQRWQRRSRSSWPSGSFSELQWGHFHKHMISKILGRENVGAVEVGPTSVVDTRR